jgi:ubiquinone/menaquinone biosynthesis C-methylase UbiE
VSTTLEKLEKGKYSHPNQNSNIPAIHSEDVLTEGREYWWNEDFLELTARRLNFKDCVNVADIGCGIGTMSFALSKYFPQTTVINGLDVERRHIRRAIQRSKKVAKLTGHEFRFIEGNASEIPYADHQMDLSFCQTLLIHMEDPLTVLKEMKRITRHEGWVLALEPNNLVTSLMFDTYAQTHYSIPELLKVIEVRLRCENGKRNLGLGYDSVGDALPDLFHQVGLKDIQVWISDKALSCIPPYDTREKRVRVSQLIEWLESGTGGFSYDQNYRYFKAGGGSKSDFNAYWSGWMIHKEELLRNLKAQRYISAGGSLMYIVAGKVNKGNAIDVEQLPVVAGGSR